MGLYGVCLQTQLFSHANLNYARVSTCGWISHGTTIGSCEKVDWCANHRLTLKHVVDLCLEIIVFRVSWCISYHFGSCRLVSCKHSRGDSGVCCIR